MIKILDNFFNKEMLEKIQYHVTTKLTFEPSFYDHTTEKIKENYYGARFYFEDDPELQKTFIKQSEKKFKIKIKKVHNGSGLDIRNLDHFQPHKDDGAGKLNLFVMLKGPVAVTNGIVFYFSKQTEKGTELELDTHIGFRENRAVLFPSGHYHSPHKSNVRNLKRYTATLFIQDYEEV
tara:strand:+ start:181 stop:714 length:534 start_codon:yes stop_codon:yes gene_type:complete